MRVKELVGKEVLSSEARIVGKVHEVIFDEETFEITDLVLKKLGLQEQIRDSENVVPVELVKTIGDKVLLKSDDDIL